MWLNAPRHSDHHMRPFARFSGTCDLNTGTMLLLRDPLPVMAVLPLVHRFGVG